MIPFTPIELQRAQHEAKIAVLHASMHRPPLRPRRAVGVALVALGTWIAREDTCRPGTSSVGAPA